MPRLWERHLLNCAVLAELVPPGARVVDVGSGAGLPGLPMALRRPDLTVDLVEPMLRRSTFLAEVVRELDLGDTVRVVRGRADEPGTVQAVGGAEWVVARAVAPLDRLARWCLPLLAPGGTLLALKGRTVADEVAQHRPELARLGAASVEVRQVGSPESGLAAGRRGQAQRERAMTDPITAPMAVNPSDVVSRETDPDFGAESAPAPIDVSRETEPEHAPAAAEAAPADVSRETRQPEPPIAREALQAVQVRNVRQERWPRPDHPRLMTVANQKGGVGKTTSAVNLAAALALHGIRVLLIDLDPQGNASTALGIEHGVGTPSIYDVLLGGRPMSEVAQRAEFAPMLRCVPATLDLAGADIELTSQVAREYRLQRALHTFMDSLGSNPTEEDGIDYVLVDCPPSLGLLTLNALVAAREVLIPIQCEYYALEGLAQLLKTVELVRSHLNPELIVTTVLLTMYDSRTRLADQVADEVRNHFGPLVLAPMIPRNVRVSEAPGFGQTVLTYDPGSRGAIGYLQAARELADRGVADAAPAAAEQHVDNIRPGGGDE